MVLDYFYFCYGLGWFCWFRTVWRRFEGAELAHCEGTFRPRSRVPFGMQLRVADTLWVPGAWSSIAAFDRKGPFVGSLCDGFGSFWKVFGMVWDAFLGFGMVSGIVF